MKTTFKLIWLVFCLLSGYSVYSQSQKKITNTSSTYYQTQLQDSVGFQVQTQTRVSQKLADSIANLVLVRTRKTKTAVNQQIIAGCYVSAQVVTSGGNFQFQQQNASGQAQGQSTISMERAKALCNDALAKIERHNKRVQINDSRGQGQATPKVKSK